jgi:hypothetical protein
MHRFKSSRAARCRASICCGLAASGWSIPKMRQRKPIIALVVFTFNLHNLVFLLSFEGKYGPISKNKPACRLPLLLSLTACRNARQLALRGGSPRFFDEVDIVTPGEWRGIHGLGHTDEDGRPLPNDSPLHNKGPVVEEEEDDYYSDDDGLEDEQLSASLLDYEVSGSGQTMSAVCMPTSLQGITSPCSRRLPAAPATVNTAP